MCYPGSMKISSPLRLLSFALSSFLFFTTSFGASTKRGCKAKDDQEPVLAQLIRATFAAEVSKSAAEISAQHIQTIEGLQRALKNLQTENQKLVHAQAEATTELTNDLQRQVQELNSRIANLSLECAVHKNECDRLQKELEAAEALINQVAALESDYKQRIADLHRTIETLGHALAEKDSKKFNHPAQAPKTPDLTPRPSEMPLLNSIRNQPDDDMSWDFSKIQANFEYYFTFARDGRVLRSGALQSIIFEPHIVEWLQTPGLLNQKRKLLKQLTMGEMVGTGQGLKHLVEDFWEIKINDSGHWRILLKKVSNKKWIAFYYTADAWVPTATLRNLSQHLN
jgi:hypothetical protein